MHSRYSRHLACVYDAQAELYSAAVPVNGKIHVYKGCIREAIVAPLGWLADFELQYHHGGTLMLWLAQKDGNVYRKNLCIKKISEIKKNIGSNQSIFDDLLQDPNPFDFQEPLDKSSTAVTFICGEDKILACEKEIRSMCCSNDILALVCCSPESSENFIHLFSIKYLSFQNCIQTGFHLNFPPLLDFSNEQMHSRHILPKIYFVTTAEADSTFSTQIKLPHHLFSALFGFEAAVKGQCVVVCGTVTGEVYYQPITSQASNFETHWHLLCTVNCPIIDICYLKVKRSLTVKESVAAELHRSLGLPEFQTSGALLDALVVCGSFGQCCLLSAVPKVGGTYFEFTTVFLPFSLPSSISYCCSEEETLFISTEQCIQQNVLTLLRDENCEQEKYQVSVTCQDLHTAQVKAMWLTCRNKNVAMDASGTDQTLICITPNGDLIEFPAFLEHSSEDCVEHLQTTLQELLISVGANSSQSEQLRCGHQRLNAFLQQLNIASLLLHFHQPVQVSSLGNPPVTCHISVHSEAEYHGIEHVVIVRVINCSDVPLTNDWCIHVKSKDIEDIWDSEECLAAVAEEPIDSYTFSLSHGLKAGQSISFRLPFQYRQGFTAIRFDVSLGFMLPQWFQTSDTLSKCIFVPLDGMHIDVLHFLHIRKPGSASLAAGRHSSASPLLAVEEMVISLSSSTHSKMVMDKSSVKMSSQSYTVCEDVPHAFHLENQTHSPLDTLCKILSPSQIDTSSLSHPSCSLEDPYGSVLTLSVEESKNCRKTLGSDASKLFVRSLAVILKSTDASLLARCRLAISRRLKISRNLDKQMTTVGDLQKLINATEVIEKQVYAVQEKFGQSKLSDADAVTSLCCLYESIRNLSL